MKRPCPYLGTSDPTGRRDASAPLKSCRAPSTHGHNTAPRGSRPRHAFPAGTPKVVKAVNGVSFVISPGEALALVGESGSGKTTVGRSLLRLIEPTGGRVTFLGQDITAMPVSRFRPLRSRLQMVFQEPFASLNPRMRVGRIVEEPLLLAGEGRRAQEARALPGGARPCRASSQRGRRISSPVQRRRTAADRHRARHRNTTRPGRARRTHFSARRVGPRGNSGSARRSAAQAEPRIPLHLARSRGGATRLSAGRHHVSRPNRRDGRAPTSCSLSRSTLIAERSYRRLCSPIRRRIVPRFLLTGEIPSPINLPTGCHLHQRCPRAQPICATEAPGLETIMPGHLVSCFFAPGENPLKLPID